MLRVHLHRQHHGTRAYDTPRSLPSDQAATPRAQRPPICGYRLEAAARRVGVYSRFERDQGRG